MNEWYVEKIIELLQKIKSPEALRHIFNYAKRAFETEQKE